MNTHRQSTRTLIDPGQLQLEIQERLHRQERELPNLQLVAELPRFDSGHWRVFVRAQNGDLNAGELARTLASVEEEMFEEFGMNVVLTFARD